MSGVEVGPATRVAAALGSLAEHLVDEAAALIRIPSVDPSYPGQDFDQLVGGERAANTLLERLYREAGCETHWVERVEGRGNLVGVLPASGPGGRSLILNGHVDVVPAGKPEHWRGGDPFSGRIADGRIHGRGASDQKGALVAAVMAVMAIRRAGSACWGTSSSRASSGRRSATTTWGSMRFWRPGSARMPRSSRSQPLRWHQTR